MRQKLVRLVTAVILMCGLTAEAFPQSSTTVPQKPPPRDGFGPPGPGGPMGPMFAFEGLVGNWGGKTVTGAPFSAQVTTEFVQILADGNKIDRKSTGTIARNSAGRTRREMLLPHLGPWAATGEIRRVVSITDPVAGVNYMLDLNNKTAHQFAQRPHGNFTHDGAGKPPFPGGPNAQTTTESLGQKTIEGLTVEGTRTTHTIPAGQIGNANPIIITVERWYSPDLQVNVLETRSDPLFGTTTYQLTNISRQEPAQSLFTVPADFTVTQGRGFSHRPGGLATPNSNQD